MHMSILLKYEKKIATLTHLEAIMISISNFLLSKQVPHEMGTSCFFVYLKATFKDNMTHSYLDVLITMLMSILQEELYKM